MKTNFNNNIRWLIKLNMVFVLCLITILVHNKVVFASTRNGIKGGVTNYPLIRGKKIELLLWLENYVDPQFDIVLVKGDGTRIDITKEYDLFEKREGAYFIRFNRTYNRDYKQIEIKVTEELDNSKVDRIKVALSVTDESIQQVSYIVKNKRNDGRDNIFDKNGLIKDDSNISKNLVRYIDEKVHYLEDEIVVSSFSGELYKLHVYDVDEHRWIIDDEDYRKEINWKAQKSGRYILDLWIKTEGSEKKYDRWVIMPLNIEKRKKINNKQIIQGNFPIFSEDITTFYLKTDSEEMVQYKAWIIDKDNKRTQITNGYSEFVDGEYYFELKTDMKLEPGRYKIWVWIRMLGDDDYFTSSGGSEFAVLPKVEGIETYYGGELMTSQKNFIEDKEIDLLGVNYLETPFNDYMYKVNILDTRIFKSVFKTTKFEDHITWKPEKSGEYMLNITMVDKQDIISPQKDKRVKEIQRIKIIRAAGKNDDLEDKKKFVIVNTFKELNEGIENDFIMLIKNPKVREAYVRLLELRAELFFDGMSSLEKLVRLNEFMISNTEYDISFLEEGYKDIDSINMYGVLMKNKAVCEGYADTTKAFLDLLNIPNRKVEGSVRVKGDKILSHVWNVVVVNGKEYYLDTTFNDPIGGDDKLNYSRFLASDKVIEGTHEWDKEKYEKLDNDEFEYFADMESPIRVDEWIYFLNKKDRNRLYKIKVDGTEKRKLSNEVINEFIVDEEWVFFTVKFGGYIYRINKDGLGFIKLNNEPSMNIRTENSWVVYKNVYDESYYMVKKDGKKKLPYDSNNKR